MIDVKYNPETKTLEITGMNNYEPDHYTGDYENILNGFTYNGTYSQLYHVDYIPDASDLWFAGTDWDVYDTEVAWHNGGYYYGNAAKAKEFKLKCFFEEITIKQREDIRKWLHRDTHGQLMFDRMPFVYWNVRPTKIVTGQEYIDCGRYSGLMDITFTAYEPFGYLTRKSNGEENDDNATDYCDLIKTSEMPASPTTSSRTFDIYNPGREVCGLRIKISGSVSNPIEFLNTTNKTRCIINSLPANNLVLDIDSDLGIIKTYLANNPANADRGYAYHDRGYIRLEPGMNKIDIMEQNSSGSWVTPTTLNLTSIGVDYSPRVL